MAARAPRRLTPPGAMLLLAGLSCTRVSGTAGRDLEALKASPAGYLTGPVIGLSERAVLDARDFTWAIDLSAAPAVVAYTHLAAQQFKLALWEADETPQRLIADVGLNEVRFDVEGVAVSRDGRLVAAASRDGSLKLFERKTAKLLRALKTDEPLVAVAFSPDARYLAVGSSKGLITLFLAEGLLFGAERRAHTDEIRSLAFDAKGTLWSGGWDKSILPLTVGQQEVAATEARVRFDRQGAFATLHGSVEGKAPVTLAYDARSPITTLTSAAATQAGIDVPLLTDSARVQTAAGPTLVKVARSQTLIFKSLRVEKLEIAICDSCAPAGADGLLGENFLSRFDVVFDPQSSEAIISLKDKADAQKALTVSLAPGARLKFEQYVNDFTVDREGQRLGVAFGATKSERNLDVYTREKRKFEEPLTEGNAGAIVDAASGQVLKRFVRHHGIVSTAAISPDGRTLATGGWDKKLLVFGETSAEPVHASQVGWSVRRLRFSPDGRFLAMAAWTPQTGYADKDSDPAAVLFDVRYGEATAKQ